MTGQQNGARKTGCCPRKYRIDYLEKFGRFLRAAKDLSAGEVILREEAVAVGPGVTGTVSYMCFACLRFLPSGRKVAGVPEPRYVCPRCNVAPLCGLGCEVRAGYHSPEECEIFRKNSNLSPANVARLIGVLLPLRLWIVRQTNPELWRRIEGMESHMAERRGTSVWKDREENVIDVMEKLALIPDRSAASSLEALQHICGVLDVNAFEVRSPGGLEELPLRGLYPEASLMAHDCRGNTHLTVDDNFQLTVYAGLPIKQDEPILFNYTSALLGTLERREHLLEGKYFLCECPLCRDPYALGAHTSSVVCPRCRLGSLGMRNPLAAEPYAKGNEWQCDKCRRTFGARLIRATVNICRDLIDRTDRSDVKALEDLSKRLSGSLHGNHFLMLSLKQDILAVYKKAIDSRTGETEAALQRMLDISKELYGVLDILEPGISRLKGILLYEMHLPIATLANRAYAANRISAVALSARLEEAAGVLKKGLAMLILEPASTPEGRLAKAGLRQLKTLHRTIADVKSIGGLTEERNANFRCP